MNRSFLFWLITCFSLPCAMAQFSGPGGAGMPGGRQSTIGELNSLDFPGSAQTPTPVFISGKVVLAEGVPVPGSVNIERVCGSSELIVAYTDNTGHFNFEWGQPTGMLPDVSQSLSFTGADPGVRHDTVGGSISNCELRAGLPGYRSDSIDLDGHRASDNPNVGTIVLHRLASVQGLSVSATSYQAPPQARKAYDKGLESLRKGKAADAGKNFEKAVAIYPQYANGWLDLGKARMMARSFEPAREAFLKALEADNKLVEAHIELGVLAAGANRWLDAAKYFDTSLRLDPVDFPGLWFADAVANYNVRNLDAAEKSVREALKVDPQHQKSGEQRLSAMILAARQTPQVTQDTALTTAETKTEKTQE